MSCRRKIKATISDSHKKKKGGWPGPQFSAVGNQVAAAELGSQSQRPRAVTWVPLSGPGPHCEG